MKLKEKHCVPCPEGTVPLNSEEIEQYKKQVLNHWKVIDGKYLKKEYPFENFKLGMAFAQNIALLADKEDHHPDVCIQYKSVEVKLSTHNIGGLSENDFIMAAKIDEL